MWEIIAIVLAVLWLGCGIISLYRMDFTKEIRGGFEGTLVIVGMTLLCLALGPILLSCFPKEPKL